MGMKEDLVDLKVEKDNPILPEDNDNDDLLFVRIKKEKEKSKKKKKEKKSPLAKKLDSIIGDVEPGGDPVDEDAFTLTDLARTIRKNTKKKGKKLEFDLDGFKDDTGENRKKKKNLRKKYEAMYKDEEALLSALLKETNGDIAKIRGVLDAMYKSSIRGASKTLSDLASTVVSANGNRLQIIKAKIDLKNKINDFVNKEEAKKKNDDDVGLDQRVFGTNLLNQLFANGRSSLNQSFQEVDAVSQEEYDSLREQIERGAPEEQQHSTFQAPEEPTMEDIPVMEQPEFDADLENRLDALNKQMKDHEIYGRSDAGDKQIEYEKKKIQICIHRWTDAITGDTGWDFVAVDGDGNEVPDYEVPDKKTCAPVKFTPDSNVASDRFGRTYLIVDDGEV